MPHKIPGLAKSGSDYNQHWHHQFFAVPSPATHWSTIFASDFFQDDVEDVEIEDNQTQAFDTPLRSEKPVPVDVFIRYKKTQARRRMLNPPPQAEQEDEASEEEDHLSELRKPDETVLTQQPKVRQNGKLLFAKIMLKRPPSGPPTLSRSTSIPNGPALPSSSEMPDTPPAPPILKKAFSAPSGPSTHSASGPSQPWSQSSPKFVVPDYVTVVDLVPAQCYSTTLINRDTGTAVEVAWRTSGFLRVLPIIGLEEEACSLIEKRYLHLLCKKCAKEGRDIQTMRPLELTQAVVESLESLKTIITDATLPVIPTRFHVFKSGCAWNKSLNNSLRSVTGSKTRVMSHFDQWLDSEELEKAEAASRRSAVSTQESKSRLQAYRIAAAKSVFGAQECVVCGDVVSIPNLSADGRTGGASLSECGHWCCIDCWRGYLASACGDGAGRIACPAYQCKGSHLSRGALAHLVQSNQQGSALFNRLEAFRAEKARFLFRISDESNTELYTDLPQLNNTSRYCPDPRCSRLLRPMKSASTLSADPIMLLCDCGGVVCAACGAEDGHLGLSCEENRDHLKRAAEIQKEAETFRWLENHTKPCPKCTYPIEKNGGCLHMRCQQCNHYFCWQCMGRGELCQSFKCMSGGSSKSSASDPTADRLDSQYLTLNNYRVALDAIKQRRSLLNDPPKATQKEEPLFALNAQLLLLRSLIGLRSWLNSKKVRLAVSSMGALGASRGKKNAELLEHSQRVDLMIHVLSERNYRARVSKSSGSFSVVGKSAMSTKADQNRKRLEMNRRSKQLLTATGNHEVSALVEAMVDQELEELLNLPPDMFKQRVSAVIKAAVKVLYVASPSQSVLLQIKSQRLKEKNNSKSSRGSSRPAEDLVKRASKFSGTHLPGGAARRGDGVPPWQKQQGDGLTYYEADVDTSGVDTKYDNAVARLQWKGKQKAKARRQHFSMQNTGVSEW